MPLLDGKSLFGTTTLVKLLNQQLQYIVRRLQRRLWQQGLLYKNCVADTGYSSGENYAFLENQNLRSFIPPHGTYKCGATGFIYNGIEDLYLCPRGEIIPFRKVFIDSRTQTRKKSYRASRKICKGCPLRENCLGKVNEKQFSVTYYREEYERNIERVKGK